MDPCNFLTFPDCRNDDTYYFIYSSEVMHELCYATSKDPLGPYKYGGVIVSNCDLHIDSYKKAEEATAYGANNHGSINPQRHVADKNTSFCCINLVRVFGFTLLFSGLDGQADNILGQFLAIGQRIGNLLV